MFTGMIMPDSTIVTNVRTLNNQDYKTLALSALGGALEFYVWPQKNVYT